MISKVLVIPGVNVRRNLHSEKTPEHLVLSIALSVCLRYLCNSLHGPRSEVFCNILHIRGPRHGEVTHLPKAVQLASRTHSSLHSMSPKPTQGNCITDLCYVSTNLQKVAQSIFLSKAHLGTSGCRVTQL